MFDQLTPAQASAVLGAMSTVVDHRAAIRGGLPSLGQQLMQAAATLVFPTPPDGDVLGARPAAPDQLAVALAGDPELGRDAAELIAVAALTDGRLVTDRLHAALDYASALGVEEAWPTQLVEVASGNLERAMHDMVLRNAATFPGLALAGHVPDLLPYDGQRAADQRLYAKFEELEGYPKQTYGHAFWVHFRRHGFRFPGQVGAYAAAFSVPHDGLHVLSGYDTSIQGELLVSTFTGAMHRVDPLATHLLPVIFEWHLSQEVNGIGAQHGALDPWKFLKAWKRGDASGTDVLAQDWRFFDVADVPLSQLRELYGIEDLPDDFAASGPEVNVTSEADPDAS